ncbi:hypothetical protein [Rhizobium halophilum]|uniref:hypothetical protein n=1 Tax=Rhizobium halophilum TaxID=2846852 RepID=UPI001EFCE260|nr:hypothetical protein [Rhizobium halophilum]MCF6371322.1 hypothetical protein [Rhizobium halophilum]
MQQKTAKQERPVWQHATFYAIKAVVAFGVGLGLTLALVAAALANQAALHEQFCHPVDYVAEVTEAVSEMVR